MYAYMNTFMHTMHDAHIHILCIHSYRHLFTNEIHVYT